MSTNFDNSIYFGLLLLIITFLQKLIGDLHDFVLNLSTKLYVICINEATITHLHKIKFSLTNVGDVKTYIEILKIHGNAKK